MLFPSPLAFAPPSFPRVLSLLFLAQVPVIQLLLGQTGLVSSETMFAAWRYVVVGAVVAGKDNNTLFAAFILSLHSL